MGSKTVHQQNPPVLYWRCWLTQVDLCNGRRTPVVVVFLNKLLLCRQHVRELNGVCVDVCLGIRRISAAEDDE